LDLILLLNIRRRILLRLLLLLLLLLLVDRRIPTEGEHSSTTRISKRLSKNVTLLSQSSPWFCTPGSLPVSAVSASPYNLSIISRESKNKNPRGLPFFASTFFLPHCSVCRLYHLHRPQQTRPLTNILYDTVSFQMAENYQDRIRTMEIPLAHHNHNQHHHHHHHHHHLTRFILPNILPAPAVSTLSVPNPFLPYNFFF
jgi:hypothetical protein